MPASRIIPAILTVVSVVEEIVRMIEAQRTYEGASKALMAHDEQTGKLITAYGRG